MDVELKPCPFCGNDVNDDEGCFQAGGFRSPATPHWVVRCGNPSCNAETSAVNREDAIAAWNNRHGASDADRSAELTTAWMAGAERERERDARDAEDAARYRWLRDKANYANRIAPQVCVVDCMKPYEFRMLSGDDVDAAIDAARAGERGVS